MAAKTDKRLTRDLMFDADWCDNADGRESQRCDRLHDVMFFFSAAFVWSDLTRGLAA